MQLAGNNGGHAFGDMANRGDTDMVERIPELKIENGQARVQ